ncbi:flavin-containing monooxygenase [Blastopirellula marina]|uniref:Monooxygenase n=1 Tax=Blastopirellula marina TaxID=124 RepID=A0A2S8GKC2_9BACT|nr:NAD(P)-binding domain-containing protein [Blastopirellula marina]PQO44885.1 monooxygenase [Blastopirellula marina]
MNLPNDFKVLVIGAGPSGLVTLKTLRQFGIEAVCVDRGERLGGNWDIDAPHSSVYQSTHLISSKGMTQFADFPMPEDYPQYPSHHQVLAYLNCYADRFELDQYIHKKNTVNRVAKADDGWIVTTTPSDGLSEAVERYHAVVVANGHHAVPMMPNLAGNFAGELIHAHDYKHHQQLEGKRVLVVGAGNSGCDIAVEAAIHAGAAGISMRRGYHFFPKFIRGKPADVVGDRLRRWPLPRSMKKLITQLAVDWTIGRPQRYGLPRPDHQLFETHPIINSQLPYYAGHGKLAVYPDIRQLDAYDVIFVDGQRATFDTIVCATGYQLTFPFIAPELLNMVDGVPKLYLHAFHPTDDTLFVAGMIQPNSGQWPLTDLQAQIIARFLKASQAGSPAADAFRKRKQTPHSPATSHDHYLPTVRHRLEVDYFDYRRTLEKIVRQLDTGSPES